MKYIDADKLRAKIEKKIIEREKELKPFSDEDYICSVASDIACRKRGYLDVIELLDSLQQEQPEVDLDKESLKYFSEIRVKDDETPILCDFKFKVNFATIARHFFELGLNARKED